MPTELMIGRMIERFGVQAVLHREYIGAGEAFTMIAAENITNAYRSRAAYRDKDGSENWAEWSLAYPELSAILARVEMEVGDGN